MTTNIELAERPRCVLALRPAPTEVGVARRVLRAALREREQPHLADDACLIAGELVTNAVEHAGRIALVAHRTSKHRLTLEVWDDNPVPPAFEEASPDSLGGRGLLIVGTLASAWGWRPAYGGKVVWAAL
ncbi:ATP-binding protein [Actinomadura rugatobispora]|uniref:ATP-binding protein n=1 Tax=Actinomadura rugatobispora TaxID=1994 RepID=A0ABW1AE65_9ACTN